MILIKILTLTCLLMIFFQDVKSRSVHWILFPVLTGLLLSLHYFQYDRTIWTLQSVAFNIVFFLGQLLLVTIFFSVRNKKLTDITSGLLGWGDLLFIFSIAFYLSIFNFMLFYIGSLIVVLLFWLVWQSVVAAKEKHIPLAGMQALLFAGSLLCDWELKTISLTDDTWILNLIAK